MVYCGRPSRGCQMCRTRRIKCDETKPTCLQCQKSRRQCPGYRDDFDLVFRNETQATERRARKAIYAKKVTLQAAHNAQRRISIASSAEGSCKTGAHEDSSMSFVDTPTISVEQHALHYFLSNFVLLPAKEGRRGFFEFLIPLIRNEPPDSHLSVSFRAVALAAFGNRPNAKRLLVQASSEYSKALSYTNAALANPLVQKSDQTLAAVLLLGLFETITLRRSNMATWGTHITGAVTLVRMRGKKQLRTKIGCSLFLTVRAQMLVHCLTASKSPEMGPDWWAADAGKDHVLATVIKLNILVSELRADTNRAMTLTPRTPDNFSKIFELLHRAQELEQGYLDWIDNLSDAWLYKTVAWVDAVPDSDLSNSEVYPGRVDMYTDLNIAGTWNGVRVARLFLAGIAIRCAAWIVSPIDYRTTPEYASASRLGTEMVNDMIASIPFHLGWSYGQDRYDFKSGGISVFVCGEDYGPAGKVIGALFLSWPMFTINCSDFTTDAQRRWIIGRLSYMSDILGLSQASVLSHFQLRLPSMIVKRDGMGLASPDAKVLGSDLGELPSAGYPTNPLTKTPIPQISASPANLKNSFFYSPISMKNSLSNTPTLLAAVKDNMGSGRPQEKNVNSKLTSNDIGVAKLLGAKSSPSGNDISPLNAFNGNIVGPIPSMGTIRTSVEDTSVSPVSPVRTVKSSFNYGGNAEEFSASQDDAGSDNEDEIQGVRAAERSAIRKAEEIAFAYTFGDAIRSTTGEEVGMSIQSTMSLGEISPTKKIRFQNV